MDRKQTVAGVVLTLNEEQNLSRALNSLAWCDELVVVDSGSTDRTCEVAAEYGARFVQHIQTPPFLVTEQRNWTLDMADINSDWVLFLDADEEVGSDLATHIRTSIDSCNSADAYELAPRYWFFGKWLKHTQGYPNWHPRLVRLGSAYFTGGVWESFSSGTLVGRISIPYEHYAFSKGLDDWLRRHQRYADWDAQEIERCINTGSPEPIKTTRARNRRIFSSYLWRIKPILRFSQKYFIQGGFLDGWQGLLFSLMMAWFDLMVIIKLIENRRQKIGLNL